MTEKELLQKAEYLRNPCRAAALPYWKEVSVCLPENMRVVHDRDFSQELLTEYADTPYFRLLHTLQSIDAPVLPQGFEIANAEDEKLAAHINLCYGAACVDVHELKSWRQRKTYCEELWITVCDATGRVAASGIAEIDRDIREGVLEWIQVSPENRRRGLGKFIVLELLCRMQSMADFVTVSGEIHNLSQPEKLYRSCGFTGDDIWHVLRLKE